MADKFKACSVPYCNGNSGRDASGRKGFCSSHYERLRRHGDPLAGRTPKGELNRFYEEVVLEYDGDDCLLWPYAKTEGYGVMNVAGKMRLVHRLLCEEVNGPPPTPEHQAAHSCGKGHEGCVTKHHLSWKTSAENHADKLVHGTHNRGERHPLAKLTEAQAREIGALKGQKLLREIAEIYGVSQSRISLIHAGKSWESLSKDG